MLARPPAYTAPLGRLDRISRALKTTERRLDDWIANTGHKRARAWRDRYWSAPPVPLPDRKYLWPHAFKRKGHRAMLVTGYSGAETLLDGLRTIYEAGGYTAGRETYELPLWIQVVRFIDRRDIFWTLVVLMFKAGYPALALLCRFRHFFDGCFDHQMKRPLVLYVVAPDARRTALAPHDAAEARARGLTVVCDATGIVCSGTFEDSRRNLSRRAVGELSDWALGAAQRAVPADVGHQGAR